MIREKRTLMSENRLKIKHKFPFCFFCNTISIFQEMTWLFFDRKLESKLEFSIDLFKYRTRSTLGRAYNEFGYNEHPAATNSFFRIYFIRI